MNRREMLKTVAGVVVGGPAACAATEETCDCDCHVQPASYEIVVVSPDGCWYEDPDGTVWWSPVSKWHFESIECPE